MNATHNGFALTIERKHYALGQIALQAWCEDGPYMMCTVCIPDVDLADNEVIIKNYSENTGILDALMSAGIVSAPTRDIHVGYAIAHVCLLLS